MIDPCGASYVEVSFSFYEFSIKAIFVLYTCLCGVNVLLLLKPDKTRLKAVAAALSYD